MGEIIKSEFVKYFCGIIFNGALDLITVKKELSNRFGEIDSEFGPVPFQWTDYYIEEMGKNLFKSFVSFKALQPKDSAPDFKIITNEIELRFMNAEKRTVNLDPGYIEMSKLILMTTKNFSHRIFIGKDIYAEITLILRNGRWDCLDWTYPDFKSSDYLHYFKKLREIYRSQMKSNRNKQP
ncbi:MAG TPA: DUF4416 family protein [Firmicutes bacterium]|nr:DUF4416 family protein [Bacillota bacterium]